MRKRLSGAGPRTVYISDPEIWRLAQDKATAENRSLSEVIQGLLRNWIKT
jgi:hypothetical protein